MARQAGPVAGPIAPAPWHKPHRPEDSQDCQQRGEDMLFRLSCGGDAERPELTVPSAADLSADPAFDPGPELAVPVRRALEVGPAGDEGGAVADIPTVLTKLKVLLPACHFWRGDVPISVLVQTKQTGVAVDTSVCTMTDCIEIHVVRAIDRDCFVSAEVGHVHERGFGPVCVIQVHRHEDASQPRGA